MVTKHHPSLEERDERVVLPLPPEEAIAAVLAAGPHPQEGAEDQGGNRAATTD